MEYAVEMNRLIELQMEGLHRLISPCLAAAAGVLGEGPCDCTVPSPASLAAATIHRRDHFRGGAGRRAVPPGSLSGRAAPRTT
jgi:hypothetical protein